MPSFVNHRRFNYIVFIVLSLILYKFDMFNWIIMATIAIGVLIGTEFITPDLDTVSTVSGRMGVLWWPYRLFRKHRGISHSIVLGFIERITYLFVLISIGIALISWDSYIKFLKFLIDPAVIALVGTVLFGIMIANGLHIVLDGIVTRMKT